MDLRQLAESEKETLGIAFELAIAAQKQAVEKLVKQERALAARMAKTILVDLENLRDEIFPPLPGETS